MMELLKAALAVPGSAPPSCEPPPVGRVEPGDEVLRRAEAAAREYLRKLDPDSAPPLRQERPAGTLDCMACGCVITREANRCPSCGWSYDR